MRRIPRAIALSAVAAGLLVGCGKDGRPKAESSSSAPSSESASSPVTTPCGRLTSADFLRALRVSFDPSGKPTESHCAYRGVDGSHLSLLVQPESGSAAEILQAAQSGCDAGTAQAIDVGDGGFTCLSGGLPEGVAVRSGTRYQLNTALLERITNDTALRGFPQLLALLV